MEDKLKYEKLNDLIKDGIKISFRDTQKINFNQSKGKRNFNYSIVDALYIINTTPKYVKLKITENGIPFKMRKEELLNVLIYRFDKLSSI